jgi:hypothetical protein
MTSNTQSNQMQRTGTVLSWLVAYAVVAALIFIVASIRSNSGTGNPQFVNGVGPILGFSILAAAAVALVLCLVGLVRWPAQIIRSPRWVLSAIGIMLIVAGAVLLVSLAAFVAIQHP